MGQANSGCGCSNEEYKEHLENYVDLPLLTKEDVQQIWKCFEYLDPKNGVVGHKGLLQARATAPAYMNEIVETMLSSQSDVTFDEFFRIMRPKLLDLKRQGSDSVLMESNSTNVSCLICPYSSVQKQNT